ncbi:MAG: 8-amino-7-oxononanoate synthase [Hyphomicrobiaceae bacterium]|nr:8-amino-7-oxononanoate synthase [Hyphomicrobiaceae bacterium]
MHDTHRRSLDALARRQRIRTLQPRQGLDFSSNDYLGIAQSDALKKAARTALENGVPVGAGGSRLLRGNHPEHELLETEAAEFFAAQTALFFNSGFAANTALFAALPQRGDLIVHDALIHASVHDGMAMSRAEHRAFSHNDPDAAADAIIAWRKSGGKGRPWIAIETLYSMDGDTAPLHQLADVAQYHDAMLVLDEAHATGVLGQHGRGLGARLEGNDNVIALHTCGKALGASGAIITLPAILRDYMVNRARPFIYATAPSPLMAATVRAALGIIRTAIGKRENLAALTAHTGTLLKARCGVTPTGTHIQPVIVGRDARALAIATALQNAGFDVRAIRPPTVPEGSARLRLSLTLNVTTDDITHMIDILAPLLNETAP